MSIEAISPSKTNNRQWVNYIPSVWGDYFLKYATNSSENEVQKREHQKLKEEVEGMLAVAFDNENILKKLYLIDTIQRLGISYLFESELDQLLEQVYKKSTMELEKEIDEMVNTDLFTASLQFRLLRQQGYKISCDVFKKFKDDKGNFKESLVSDVRGILCLYDATHLRVHEENILDEAFTFTLTQLESLVLTQLNPNLAEQVAHALKQSLFKGIQRVEARHYISIYEQETTHNPTLLLFAKLDFNLLQTLHQKEISELTRWWIDLDLAKKLPFGRDKLVEAYFWANAVYFEPKYSIGRKILAQVAALGTLSDDIYDVYGTLEELELFTDLIERWDINVIDELPNYMKEFYKAFMDLYSKIEEKLVDEGQLYQFSYLKEATKNQFKCYLVEAKWYHSQYVPTLKEYHSIAFENTWYEIMQLISFVGMGRIVTEDTLKWFTCRPKIVTASFVICRLMDDIVTCKLEQERGHIPTSIELYMKQYDATKEEAIEKFQKQITNAWKDTNEEFFYPRAIPKEVLERILNHSRAMDVFYKGKDHYTHCDTYLKDLIISVFVHPISI